MVTQPTARQPAACIRKNILKTVLKIKLQFLGAIYLCNKETDFMEIYLHFRKTCSIKNAIYNFALFTNNFPTVNISRLNKIIMYENLRLKIAVVMNFFSIYFIQGFN